VKRNDSFYKSKNIYFVLTRSRVIKIYCNNEAEMIKHLPPYCFNDYWKCCNY